MSTLHPSPGAASANARRRQHRLPTHARTRHGPVNNIDAPTSAGRGLQPCGRHDSSDEDDSFLRLCGRVRRDSTRTDWRWAENRRPRTTTPCSSGSSRSGPRVEFAMAPAASRSARPTPGWWWSGSRLVLECVAGRRRLPHVHRRTAVPDVVIFRSETRDAIDVAL